MGGGDHGDGQYAQLLRGVRHHGDRPGARAAAHARSEENSVRMFKNMEDIVPVLLRRHAAHLRLGTGALTMGKLFSDLHPLIRRGGYQRRPIGIDVHIGDAVQPGRAHPAHHIIPRSADTDDLHVHHIRHLFIILLSSVRFRFFLSFTGECSVPPSPG